jgi:hypothetical protein
MKMFKHNCDVFCFGVKILCKVEASISRVKAKAVPLHAVEALVWRGGIAPSHS